MYALEKMSNGCVLWHKIRFAMQCRHAACFVCASTIHSIEKTLARTFTIFKVRVKKKVCNKRASERAEATP